MTRKSGERMTPGNTGQYEGLTEQLEKVRRQKADLLMSADLPLPELSVKDGELVYKGQKWDNMSGSDRLKVSTAIVRKLNPKCGFVLLTSWSRWTESPWKNRGMAGAGRPAGNRNKGFHGDECSIIIEDGYAAGQAQPAVPGEKYHGKQVNFNENYQGKIPGAKKSRGLRPEGIGKSTFASYFPDPIFIDTEGSTKDMDVARLRKRQAGRCSRSRLYM